LSGTAPEAARRASRVTLTSRPWWLIRLSCEAPRYLVFALCFAGLAASARFAIAPPSPQAAPATAPAAAPADPAAAAYATLFARRYLSWNAAEPQAGAQSLEPFLGPGMEPDAGRVLPPAGEQQVQWAEVVQAREPQRGEHIYTVAAQTDRAGLLYLTVGVMRTPEGTLAITGYPAFVGAPASAPARIAAHLAELSEPELATVVARALRNYLAGSSSELAADLSSGARVSLPGIALDLDAVQRLSWSTPHRSVLAVVQAHDGRGLHYTLAYELDVLRDQGRWEISAVQTDPDA